MIKILQEFLDRLEIASSSPMGLVAYVSLAFIGIYFYNRNKQLVALKKLTMTLDSEDKRKAIEQKFNTSIDPNTSPKEWLEHKKIQYKLIAFLGSLLILVMIFSMAYQVKLERGGNSPGKSYNFVTISNTKIEEQSKKLIDNYLRSLTEESFVGNDFFAENVERFFNIKYSTPEGIENYIRSEYYPNFLNRRIYSLPSTWTLIEKKNDYCIFTLEIDGSWVSRKTKKSIRTKTKMRLKVTNQYKIAYWNEEKILFDSRRIK